MERIYVLIMRHGPERKWMPAPDGVVSSQQLAEFYIKLRRDIGDTAEYAIVEGPICSPAEMELAATKVEC